MNYNYLKITLRSIKKRPLLTLLKVFGLGIAVAASILLIKYVNWHWGFDDFHHNGDQIVRVQNDQISQGTVTNASAMTYTGVPVLAKENFPEVQRFVRLAKWIANDVVVSHEEQVLRTNEFYYTDSTFFDLFSFQLLRGDPATALASPNHVVLSESAATSLFGSSDPMDQYILFENKIAMKVTGIVADPPVRSHIQFSILGSLSSMNEFKVYSDQQLNHPYAYAYLKVNPGTDLTRLAAGITSLVKERKESNNTSDVFRLQPLKEIHLYSDLQQEMNATGQGNNLWMLLGISIVILLLGWVNHINLFTSSALDQVQNLSIRSIIGADRKHLFGELFVNAFSLSLLGALSGFAMAILAEPYFVQWFDVPFDTIQLISIDWGEPAFLLFLLLVIGTLLSSIIPALIVSNVKPVDILAGQIRSTKNRFSLRQMLVFFQFAIIVSLITTTLVIQRQTRYMESQPLGYDLDHVFVVRAPLGVGWDNLQKSFPEFKRRVLELPEIDAMSVSHNIPGDQLGLIEEVVHGEETFKNSFSRNYLDLPYFDVYDIPFLAEDFRISEPSSREKRYAVVNERAAQILGFDRPEDALYQTIRYNSWDTEIRGVVKNYHQQSLHHVVNPIISDFAGDGMLEDGYISLKVSQAVSPNQIAQRIESIYTSTFTKTVYDPIDIKSYFAKQYQDDRNFEKLNSVFMVLGLMIACFGLVGLLITIVARRKREFGIRKILGAKMSNNIGMLTRDFLLLVGVAWIASIPFTWYLMNSWLQNFAFQTEMPWWAFVVSGGIVVILVVLIVGVQGIRASQMNPVEVLREE